MDKTLVTIQEFIAQVWEIEHVKIRINAPQDALVYSYDFKPLAGTDTVDDLKARINLCLGQIKFIYNQ